MELPEINHWVFVEAGFYFWWYFASLNCSKWKLIAVVQSGEETAWEDPKLPSSYRKGIRVEPGYGGWGMVGEQRLKQKSQAGMRASQAMEPACAGSIHESVENQVLSSLVWSQS